MKLIEALEIKNAGPATAGGRRLVYLACGFTPLHLSTFLNAYLQLECPDAAVEIIGGVYGDLPGTIEQALATSVDVTAVVVEWADLDARLGLRQLGGWAPRLFPNIIASVRATRTRVQRGLEHLSEKCPVGLCLPTLPLPPMPCTGGSQVSTLEADLNREMCDVATWAAGRPRIRLLNQARLGRLSCAGERHDAKSELTTGFPYTIKHTDAMGSMLALLLQPSQPKKAIITDLDDTLWRGVLGEVGVNGVSWDLDAGSQLHGLYQQHLSALAESGVLIGVASKNNPKLVEEALKSQDLHIKHDQIFPIEANWSAKSQSVHRILKAWNIGAHDAVFIDDSPMELAEVRAAHPEIECLLFPKSDPAAALSLLAHLRDLFGKSLLSEEDTIRAESIRRGEAVHEAAQKGDLEDFLAKADAEITFRFAAHEDSRRAFELVNKTNQFNLNGRRYTEAEWQRYFEQAGAFLMTAGYTDKFGPLGSIAAILGRVRGRRVCVDTWVMSCRAFSRRIEHQCLRFLFDVFEADEIAFDFHPTPRNEPIQGFLTAFGDFGADCRIHRAGFAAVCPPLHHSVVGQSAGDLCLNMARQ